MNPNLLEQTAAAMPVGSSDVLGHSQTQAEQMARGLAKHAHDVGLPFTLEGKVSCVLNLLPLVELIEVAKAAEKALDTMVCGCGKDPCENVGLDDAIKNLRLKWPNDPKLSHDDREPANERKPNEK